MSSQSLREAAQQALESLDEITINANDYDFGPAYEGAKQRRLAALRALKNALAQPETGATCDNDKAQPVASSALGEVIGCFEAALAEGLQEALASTEDERLKDLVERRLMYALYAAQNAAPQPASRAIFQEDALKNLVNQIRKTSPVDDHGHKLTMNMAYLEACKLLDASADPNKENS